MCRIDRHAGRSLKYVSGDTRRFCFNCRPPLPECLPHLKRKTLAKRRSSMTDLARSTGKRDSHTPSLHLPKLSLLSSHGLNSTKPPPKKSVPPRKHEPAFVLDTAGRLHREIKPPASSVPLRLRGKGKAAAPRETSVPKQQRPREAQTLTLPCKNCGRWGHDEHRCWEVMVFERPATTSILAPEELTWKDFWRYKHWWGRDSFIIQAALSRPWNTHFQFHA